MKIAVIGSGAIGGLVAGYLRHKGEDVVLVGRKEAVAAISKDGLDISGVRGNLKIRLEILPALTTKVDVVILAVKTQDIEKAIKENLAFFHDAIILTTQNGIQAEKILAEYFSKKALLSSIVMFGATYLGANKIVHNFEGKWILGWPFDKDDKKLEDIVTTLNKAFTVVISDTILGMKWLKVFVNANNSLAAIIGKSMQDAFSNLELCKLSMRIWQEGLHVVTKAGIPLVSLPDFPLERLKKLTSLPLEESAKIFSGIMMNLSREPLYGSILQSIKRNRPSEIDYINGEFVALAKTNGAEAKLNERLVNLVHKVERSKRFLTVQELIENTKEP